jgi:hypothetical protein
VPDRRAELMTGFVTTLSQTQLNAIAQTSGGNAILRQAFRVLAAGPVKNSVGNALGQRSDPGLLSLDAWRPSVAFSEPPLCRELSIQVSVTKPPKIQQFVMTFGRRIAIGADTSTPYPNAIWTGPSITGETLPETYYDNHKASIAVPNMGSTPARAQERWDSRMRVVLPLVINEGAIEGLRMADKAFLSIGFQQWSFHVNEEGPVLLERFRAANKELFDVFFGMAGLQTAICKKDGTTAATVTDLQGDNPDAYAQEHEDPKNPASPMIWKLKDGGAIEEYYPSHVTLFGASPDQAPVLMPATNMEANGADRLRFKFFGFKVAKEPVYNADGKATTVGEFKAGADAQAWAGRFRLAMQLVPEWIPIQYHQAANRITRLQREIKVTIGDHIPEKSHMKNSIKIVDVSEVPNWCGHSHTVSEVLTSEFAVALILDIFINGTGLASAVIREAWRRTRAALAAEGIVPSSLHVEPDKLLLQREVLFRFWLALAGVRRGMGYDPDVRTTRALGMMDRQLDEVYNPSPGSDFAAGKTRQIKFDLSSAPGSFKGWD